MLFQEQVASLMTRDMPNEWEEEMTAQEIEIEERDRKREREIKGLLDDNPNGDLHISESDSQDSQLTREVFDGEMTTQDGSGNSSDESESSSDASNGSPS